MSREQLALSWKSWFSNDLTPVGPGWLQWAWTAVFCMIIAMCFTVLGFALNAMRGSVAWTQPVTWLNVYLKNLGISLVVGYTIHVMFAILIPLITPRRIRAFSHGQRALFFSAVPIVGVMIGWPTGLWLVSPEAARWDSGTYVGSFMFSLLFCFVLFQIFNAKARQAEAERRAVEAQLRLLQGQMEPHFLFNTLAGVLTLIETEPARARHMLESFTDYLRATLASFRSESSTVGRELELAEAYLHLLQARMEDRLQFTIHADEAARRASIPPMLLQPLIENAIQHGLEPKVDGGRLTVEARLSSTALEIVVTDDGLGPEGSTRGHAGNGVALANIRQRLQGLHGSDASLAIDALQPGTRATLSLPRSDR